MWIALKAERGGAEFELDVLANRQLVQLPPKLSRTGTTRRLHYHTSELVLDTLKTVDVALRRTIIETCTDDAVTDLAAPSVRRRQMWRSEVLPCLTILLLNHPVSP